MREARNEVLTSDIDVRSLEAFLERMQDGTMRICEARMVLPSKLGMSLYASAFEDLLSMRTRAYLIKDIDPEILRRLLGQRSLAAQLTKEDLASHYADKVPIRPPQRTCSISWSTAEDSNRISTTHCIGRN